MRAKPLSLPIARHPDDHSASMVCRMVFDELCVLANGDLVCSCGDPAGLRVYGNVQNDRIADIYNGPLYQEIRDWQLQSKPDSWCPVVSSLCGGRISRATAVDGPTGRAVKILQLEPISYCNLRCPACPVVHFDIDSNYAEDRANILPLKIMLDVVDQLPDLEKILFYNFGEPFLHKDAINFLCEVRSRRPDVLLHTNTNGTVLRPAQIQAIASELLLDRVVFSIDGAEPDSYRKYRVGGDLAKALGNLVGLVDASIDAGTRDRLEIYWQYILFKWNDSDQELNKAKALARKIGVPIKWVITHTEGASDRFTHDSAEFARLTETQSYGALTCELRVTNIWEHGGIAQGRYMANISTDHPSITGSPAERVEIQVGVENLTEAEWSKGGSQGFHLGVKLQSASGRLIRDLPNVALPVEAALPRGYDITTIGLVLPDEPGRYLLFIDVVEQGVCWFSERGSQPLVCVLNVELASFYAGGRASISSQINMATEIVIFDKANGSFAKTDNLLVPQELKCRKSKLMYIKMQDKSFPAQRILEDRLMASPTTLEELADTGDQELARQLMRHLYLDFLDREPDEQEINYWRRRISGLGLDADALTTTIVTASSLLLQSIEFLHIGYLVYRFYVATYGRCPRLSEFRSDTRWIKQDVVVGQAGWEGLLAKNLESFSEHWVARPTFENLYVNLNSTEYLTALCTNAGIDVSRNGRNYLSDGPGSESLSPRLILRRVVNDPDFFRNELNRAFILMLYFGYLQRNPEMDGYDYWLSQLESNLTQWDVARAFVASEEYGLRISPFISVRDKLPLGEQTNQPESLSD